MRIWQKKGVVSNQQILFQKKSFSKTIDTWWKKTNLLILRRKNHKKKLPPPTGLEPAIFGFRQVLTWHSSRRPTPYPLGHGGELVGDWGKMIVYQKHIKKKKKRTILGYSVFRKSRDSFIRSQNGEWKCVFNLLWRFSRPFIYSFPEETLIDCRSQINTFTLVNLFCFFCN